MEPSKSHGDALKARIRNVPDFPKPGILFYDVTTLLKDQDGLSMVLNAMSASHVGQHIDVVVGIESRGFILGAPLADRLRAGFVPVRKAGKLPSKTRKASYSLEYGTDALEIHEDAIKAGQRVLIVDDLLATGGTAAAAASLVKELGGVIVAVQFLIELVALNGREKLAGHTVDVVLKY